MIKYYPKLVLSFSEIPGAPTLLIHALTGCQFHCFKCFNYSQIVKNPGDDAYLITDVVDYIKKQNDLFGYIVFSGGEFLNAALNDLIADLTLVKSISDKPIIVYSNGGNPEKMQVLDERQLVDGFHVDMKLPYHLLYDDDADLIELTIGIKVKNPKVFFAPYLRALELTVALNHGYSRIRSVEYPFLNASAFEENRIFVDKLNQKHKKKTPYDVNQFIYPEVE